MQTCARVLVLLVPVLLGGCAFGDRVMLMKEFETAVPSGTASYLAGKRICVGTFTDTTDIEAKWTATQPAEPEGFEYREMSDASEDKWDAEVEQRKEGADEETFPIVGFMRNAFGMKTANVRSCVPPAEWLAQVLRLELEGQGAVASGAGEADLVVAGVIRYRRVDIYMKNWADLVVDFELRPKGGQPRTLTLHCTGSQTAWSSSSYEFYRTFRRCQQKMLMLLLPEIRAALDRG